MHSFVQAMSSRVVLFVGLFIIGAMGAGCSGGSTSLPTPAVLPAGIDSAASRANAGFWIMPAATGVSPDDPRDLQNHGGKTLSTAQSINLYVNATSNPPDKQFGYPGTFINRFSQSKMTHIMDQYTGGSANNRYPYLTGYAITHTKSGTWAESDLQAILQAAVSKTGKTGYGYIYNIFLVAGQQVCAGTFCYPKNACTAHGFENLKVGSSTVHLLFTLETFPGVATCVAPSRQFQDAMATEVAGELGDTFTNPDGTGWYNTSTKAEIATTCNYAWGDILMPGGVTYNILQMWLNSVHTCAFGPFGHINEFSLPNTPGQGHLLYGITNGPDANVWFTDSASAVTPLRIGRITPSGVVHYFTVATPKDSKAILTGITSGRDGDLWFIVGHYGGTYAAIGRMTTGGGVTLFTAGLSANPGTQGITAGPDGNVWFTEGNVSKIGRITPSGVITEFTTNVRPGLSGITSGPDGNLWFPEGGSNSIGSITPHGIVTQHPTTASTFGSNQIASAADANLWFTDLPNYPLSPTLGRMTTQGVVRGFSIPSAAGNITAGPDGDPWFTTADPKTGSPEIGRMTTTGTLTILTHGFASNAGLSGITAGPDGNIWYLDATNWMIGRVSLSSS